MITQKPYLCGTLRIILKNYAIENLIKTLSIGVIVGSALSLAIFLDLLSRNGSASLAENAIVLSHQEQASFGLPVRLKIPKINIDAPIETVGLTEEGAVDVPKGPTTAAWFDLGPRPGEIGSAVIDGHAGWKNGTPAVFDYLYKLHKGDKIYIVDENGTTTAFVVRKLRTYGADEDVEAVFVSSDGVSHLNLITCTGVWNKIDKSHPDRLVVFADKE